jgi:hypothetical protein
MAYVCRLERRSEPEPPEFEKGNRLWLSRKPNKGSILVIVDEIRLSHQGSYGELEYKVYDADKRKS